MLALSLATSVVLAACLDPGSHAALQRHPAWEEYALAAYPGNEIDQRILTGPLPFWNLVGILAGRPGSIIARRVQRGRHTRSALIALCSRPGRVFVFWFVLGRILPRSEDALGYALRYFRYALVGFWISALAPLLFERLGLVNDIRKKISPLSSGNNPL